MTQPSFEHLALLQMLDRVQALEGDVQTLMALNARLVRRVDQLEAIARAERRCGLVKAERGA